MKRILLIPWLLFQNGRWSVRGGELCMAYPNGKGKATAEECYEVWRREMINRQAGGRAIGEIEKQTVNGRVRYEVTLGSGSDKSTVLIGEDGKQVADADDD